MESTVSPVRSAPGADDVEIEAETGNEMLTGTMPCAGTGS